MKNSRVGAKPPTQELPEAGAPEPMLGHDVRVKIGRQLRAMYDDVVSQGVPDRFLDLLNRLDEGVEKDGG